MIWKCLAAAMACFLLGTTNPAQAQEEAKVDTAPDWVRRPTASEIRGMWPEQARIKGVDGEAVIRCKVSAQGAAYDCRVASERPTGVGFGVAAIALTPQMTFKPAMKNGKAVAYDGVSIPVKFSGVAAMPSQNRGVPMFKPTPVATGVRWSDGPSYADVVAAYPQKARDAKVGGAVSLDCNFLEGGRVGSCATMTEAPKGMGFATAAKSLIPKFVGPAMAVGDKSTKGARVDIKFVFAPEMLDPQARPVTGKPVWLRMPTSEQLEAALPDAARKSGLAQGRVVLNCTVVAGGRIDGCTSISEEPKGYGMGVAATALSQHLALAAWSIEGLPTIGGEVKIPLRYDFVSPAPAAKP